ncbi:MAG: MAPEG family protein [Woeseiaceae bacterium]|nr:MAPEG family protein [Woeseiaceae bacterium]
MNPWSEDVEWELVYPMATMVLLTALVLVRMVLGRMAAVRRGEVDARFYKTFDSGEGETRQLAQHTRNFINLFESPVLFYAGCITAMVVGQGTGVIIWLAWAYVVFRAIHTVVHLGSNRIPPRMVMYGASWIALLAIWGTLVVRVASTP